MTATIYDVEISAILHDLSETQSELLDLLAAKQAALTSSDSDALLQMGPQEEDLSRRLADIQERREALLVQAREEGLPHGNLSQLAESLPDDTGRELRLKLNGARTQGRLLHHQSLTNWVIVQRSMLHLTQLLEIFATGGKNRPTYGKKGPPEEGGSLLDQSA